MLIDQEEKFAQIYEAPAIIYDGVIGTRAGSPIGNPNGSSADGVDPADLFD